MSSYWTLLVVDDCAEDREVYREYLLSDPHQPYQILEAGSAELGLALCKEKHCDAILLDFCLPDMSGLEFLDEMKRQKLQVSPVVMLTGQGDEIVAVQAMKKGVQDYLIKQHLKSDVLQLAIRNVIKQAHLQAQLSQTKERQRLIATIALRIRQSLNLEQILNTAVVEVQQLLRCDRVAICQYISAASEAQEIELPSSHQTVTLRRHGERTGSLEAPKTDNTREIQQAIAIVCEAGASNCCLRQEFALLPVNIMPLESIQLASKASKSSNQHSELIVPIVLNYNDQPSPQPWGLLIAHQCSETRQWQLDEVEILNELSVQLAIAIQQAELLAKTQTALEKAKELNAFKSQIVATVSHEYRTPLASILGAASTLKQHHSQLDSLRQRRCLEIIEEKARHLAKLVDDMLVVHQSELNKGKFQPLPLDLRQFFADLVAEQQETIGTHHELILRFTSINKGFWGDPRLLRLILENLISNAIKYSPERGSIEIHLIGQEKNISFYVKDEGIGIPSTEQKELFHFFSRGSNVGTIPGTGLGLAITKACVELHGGEIILESQENQGTKVTVTLPRKDGIN